MKLIRKIFLLAVIFIFASTMSAYCKTVKKEISVQTKDAKILKATISYVKIEGVKKYPTVLLLHSLGYSTDDWGNLVSDLNNAGYLVIAMDLRGHGKSIYDAGFKKKSWVYFTPKIYEKFPNDVMLVLNEAQKQSKKVSLDNMAIVGADIGANSAVLVSKQLKKKPKALVLISLSTSFKGLYVPIAIAEMGRIPILSMASKKDAYCMQEQLKLAKYAQGGFYAQDYSNGGMGMIMIKVNPTMSQDIVKWLLKYLK